MINDNQGPSQHQVLPSQNDRSCVEGSIVATCKADIIQQLKYLSKKSSLDKTKCGLAIQRIIQLCQKHPSLATEYYCLQKNAISEEESSFSLLGLFCIFYHNVENSVIDEFCDFFPESVAQTCSPGMPSLPLHLLCGPVVYIRRSLIPKFLAFYPEAARRRYIDGNLPIQQLFQPHHIFQGLFDDPRIVQEVDAFLRAFPESFLMQSQPGEKIFQYIFSYTDIHPGLADCVLQNIPNVSKLQLTDNLFLPARQISTISERNAVILAGLIQQLTHLKFRPGRQEIFSPEGWVLFCQSFATCSQLTHLEIEIPYYLFRGHQDCLAVFVKTLPQLASLKSLIVSFSKVQSLVNYLKAIRGFVSPFVGLLHQGNLTQLIIRDGVKMNPIPILQEVANSPLSSLISLDLGSVKRGNDVDVTQAIADLIASNGILQSLAVSYHVPPTPRLFGADGNRIRRTGKPPTPVFEAFAHNTHIKSIQLPGLIGEVNGGNSVDSEQARPYQCLSLVLQHKNSTLEEVVCPMESLESLEYKRIRHYALLNRFGRGKLWREATAGTMCQVLIQLLSAVLQDEGLQSQQNSMTSVIYGLMGESPGQWCNIHC